jgi:glycosyltransferase involved in cell wall biosynthesis
VNPPLQPLDLGFINLVRNPGIAPIIISGFKSGVLNMDKKLLLITLPIDLGSVTLEKNFIKLFENHIDLKLYHFSPDRKWKHLATNLDYAQKVSKRLLDSYELWQEVNRAQSEDRKILFVGLSPALFAYPATKRNSSYLVTDWTRKLYEPILGISMSPPLHTFVHKQTLKSQKYIFGLTDIVVEEIAKDYDVPKHKLINSKLPVDINLFTPSPNRDDDEVRLLFVGGDVERKGGDILLRWFREHHQPNVRMTMITKSKIESHPQINVVTNVQYGEPKHIDLFKSHDLFVLPTKCDAYPCVLGEATSAGLAMLTTKNALGAPEVIKNGVNGYICDSEQELLNKLNMLVKNKLLIESMKRKSREFMEKEFNFDVIRSNYINCIFGDV